MIKRFYSVLPANAAINFDGTVTSDAYWSDFASEALHEVNATPTTHSTTVEPSTDLDPRSNTFDNQGSFVNSSVFSLGQSYAPDGAESSTARVGQLQEDYQDGIAPEASDDLAFGAEGDVAPEPFDGLDSSNGIGETDGRGSLAFDPDPGRASTTASESRANETVGQAPLASDHAQDPGHAAHDRDVAPRAAQAWVEANEGSDGGRDYASGEVIVKLNSDNVSAEAISTLKAEMGASVMETTQQLGIERWQLDGMTTDEAVQKYADHSLIEYIEPNYIVSADGVQGEAVTPNDPRYDELWGLNNTGQTGGTPDADIDAPEAWEETRGSDVVAGVIDTGVDYTHPDLDDNMWVNSDEIPNNGVDDDNNGYVDDVHGADFINDDGDPLDDNGHGTHVSGTLAAEGNNGTGVTGVNWSADIMGLKFLGADGFGSIFDAIEAVEYATQNGADLTNNSWGGGGFSQGLRDAIEAAGNEGQPFVAAAGNAGQDTDQNPHYPSSYTLDNVISVAATDDTDSLADFSNFGATSVDLAAPGVEVLSTLPNNDYGFFSGTSMASPHTAGVAALLLDQNPSLSPSELRSELIDSVDEVPELQGQMVSDGRLNAANALGNPQDPPEPPDGPVVGYYDMNGEGIPSQIGPISEIGFTPKQITEPNAEQLAGVDILFAQNESNFSYGSEYLDNLSAINSAVEDGMNLVMHDRYVSDAKTILPESEGFDITRELGTEIDVVDDDSAFANGPAGTITDESLDDGNFSHHGFTLRDSLKDDGEVLLNNGESDKAVTFGYGVGSGSVHYSSVPLDFYLKDFDDPDINDAMEVYASNLLAYVSDQERFESTIAEVDRVSALTNEKQTIELSNTFQNPVVFVQPPSLSGGEPANVRVSNVTDDSFELRIQEPNYLDGNHIAETASYMVVESGNWQLENGARFAAGTENTDKLTTDGFEDISFDNELQSPSVMSQVQTSNEADFVTTRQTDESATGFQVAMQEEEALNGGDHATESVGWFAIEGGTGTWGGLNYEAGDTGDNVTDDFSRVDFDQTFEDTPNFLGGLSTFDGSDTAMARNFGLSPGGAYVTAQEEASADAETRHTTETADYFALGGSGTLSGFRVTQATEIVAEVGSVSGVTHQGQTVQLDHSFDNPVVFAQPPSINGDQPANVRLSNVTGDSFEARIQEPGDLDGNHIGEDFSYFVFEQGTWELPDGKTLSVGTTQTNKLTSEGFESLSFGTSLTNPATVSQVQTSNGGDFVTTRQTGESETGFQVAMQEEEALNGGRHITESVGWFAMEGGTGTWGGLNYEAGDTGDNVTDGDYRLNFSQDFADTPNTVAGLSSFDGSDPAFLRFNDASNSGIDLAAQEETSADAETNHTDETADFLSLNGNGTLSATPVNETMAEVGSVSGLTQQVQTIQLDHSFDNPVVFAQPPSLNGDQPANVRLSNVTGDSFELRIQEPENLDGSHIGEDLSYFVFEAGTWQLPDGTQMSVGTTDTNKLTSQGFEDVSFGRSLDDPSVLSQVQSFNGQQFVTTRQRDETSNGVELAMQEEEALNGGGHATETLGWMAFEGGHGTWDGFGYEAGDTGDNVTPASNRFFYDEHFFGENPNTTQPNLVAGLSSFDGGDPAIMRSSDITPGAFDLQLQEDTSADQETFHLTETADYLALDGNGTLSATPLGSTDADLWMS